MYSLSICHYNVHYLNAVLPFPKRITNQYLLPHAELLKYLDEFDKQMSSRRSAPSGLEEQLASLSRAYNQAQ